MRKALLIAAAAVLVGAFGTAFAQYTTKAAALGPNMVTVAPGNTTNLQTSHHVVITVPSVVMLQIQGSGTANVNFDVTTADIYSATNSAGTYMIGATSGGFQDVRGFTNANKDFVVTASIDSSATAGSVGCQIYIGTNTICSGSVQKSIVGTSGPAWTPLWSMSDFKLLLTGTETPGTYTYTVTYTAAVP